MSRTRRARTRIAADAIPTAPLAGPLLALDVSSTCTGYAVFSPAGEAIDFGVIRPDRDAPAIERIDAIVRGVESLVDDHRPAAALLEWADGRVHRRVRGRSAGTGLATLGQAQGEVRRALLDLGVPVAVVGDEWTRGRPKAERAGEVALLIPAYRRARDAGRDAGYDVADAIGLGLDYFARAREAELLARATDGGR